MQSNWNRLLFPIAEVNHAQFASGGAVNQLKVVHAVERLGECYLREKAARKCGKNELM